MRGWLRISAIGAANAALMAGQPVLAWQGQSGRTLALGDSVESSLAAGAEVVDGRNADRWQIRLRAGDPVEIDLESEAFDAFLDILTPGMTEPLLSDDDGGPSARGARLRFPAPVSGLYTIRAQGLDGGTGAYKLSARRRLMPKTPDPTALRPGAAVTGDLSAARGRDDESNPYELYGFRAAAGERIKLEMNSEAIDSRLKLEFREANGRRTQVAEDDDGGEGSNARILALAPRSGDYVVTAFAFSESAGAYTLKLTTAPAQPPLAPTAIAIGETRVSLAEDDPATRIGMAANGQGSFLYRLYALPVRRGETIAVDLTAPGDAFDPMLEAGVMSPLGFAAALANDDNGESRSSRLSLTPDRDGEIVLRVRTLGPDAAGDFVLTTRAERPAR